MRAIRFVVSVAVVVGILALAQTSHAQTTTTSTTSTSTSSSTSTSLGKTTRGCVEHPPCDIIVGGIFADPPANCQAGTVVIKTNASITTNCSCTHNNSLCLCTNTNKWTCLDNN